VHNQLKQAPRNCPVCGDILALTRLSCDECGTELAGHFPTCEYCSLAPEDRETLRVFLASRGNMKEVERHLAVSYPTARARFDAILVKLGIQATDEPLLGGEESAMSGNSKEVLDSLAKGEIDIEEALEKLG
jgi:hypothetical protein